MFQELLENISLAFESHNITYMIIGGQAVLLYGEPRLTKDIDITLGLGPDEVLKILNITQELRFKVLVESPEEFVQRTMVLPCLETKSGIRLDFIFSNSDYEQQAMGQVRRVKFGRAQVCFASPEDLIIHKVIAGRPRDLEDVRNVLIKTRDLDLEYIRKWLKNFTSTLNQSLDQHFEEVLKATE